MFRKKEKIDINVEMRYCDVCQKDFPAYCIELNDIDWILINPHEHGLDVGICPNTIWMCTDVAYGHYPEKEVQEIMNLCMNYTDDKKKQLLKLLKKLTRKTAKKKGVKSKALAKTVIYRALSIATEFGLTWFITRQPIQATAITVGCLVIHTLLYYTIEKWGERK